MSENSMHGLTLFEAILSLVILAIISGVGARLLDAGFQSYFAGKELAPLAIKGGNAMERIIKELRGANRCSQVTIGSNNITFDNATGTVTIDQLGTPANAIYLNGQPLVEEVRTGSLRFELSGCLVQVGFVLERPLFGTQATALPFRTKIVLRNP